MSRISKIGIFVTIAACYFIAIKVSYGGILDTKHNLSMAGPGPIKSTTEGEVCIFCHTPHNARRDIPYLWNRSDTTQNYITYESSTLHATVGQPTGASKLCLSCHDRTVALGALLTRPQEIPFAGGLRFMPDGPTRLGTDLSDDHPVSVVYDSSLAGVNLELADPSGLTQQVKLDKNKELQCTACHDPHNNSYGKFLVTSNQNSGLCITCHDKDGWLTTSHSTSNKQWNGSGTNPWPRTPYSTVSQNGCENCHMPHTAGGHQRLLNYSFEEDNCLVCHNGNAASKNIENELIKPYGHFVQNYAGIHDPVEDFTSGSVQKHVECVDCHNPHWSDGTTASAPNITGPLKGVKGINAGGQQIPVSTNSYEICFKCHADYNVITTLPVTRQIAQLNTRLEFDPSNPSYHPIETQGVNPNVPSLLPPYTTTSKIYCADCHNNDNALGPKGPHGSINKYLLAQNYTTTDNTGESPTAYALCYKCHSRASILGDQSFKGPNGHWFHIMENAPCSACHDAHGISSTQGNLINNRHLINFDTTIVHPDNQGRLYFEDLGTFTGRCYLSCHGEVHMPKSY
ncbi:MAG: hypothetical protein CVV37_02465 [Nitrospira bacterium HGW-Nitrospira-1]|nr:MAG: hypothetical protein CVV37_02465 [Nitrospira bacterium HGW-Nitrospira-1]